MSITKQVRNRQPQRDAGHQALWMVHRDSPADETSRLPARGIHHRVRRMVQRHLGRQQQRLGSTVAILGRIFRWCRQCRS